MKKQNRKLSNAVVRATEPVQSIETPTATEKQESVIQATQPVVHCRNGGAPIQAKKTWEVDKPIDFMWMPGGVHTIHASYGRNESDLRPIELTVHATKEGAQSVQSNFEAVRANNPRRPPFICIEHNAKERAGEPIGFEWRDAPEPAIYCRCLPSSLGATNVNGKIHTSFSPTFDTDAEYSKMHCTECDKTPSVCACQSGAGWYFPDGVKGSASNPAKVTAADVQSVGSLTNWNAFKDILPIAARENRAVQAAGTSEGAKKGWESRYHGAVGKQADVHHALLSHGYKVSHVEDFGTGPKAISEQHYKHPEGHSATLQRRGMDKKVHVFTDSKSEDHAQSVEESLDNLKKGKHYLQSTSTEETNLAVHATQANNPQPEETNEDQTQGQQMKVKFVRAHGEFKPGQEADLDVNHPAITAGDALVPAAADAVMAREAEIATAKAREKETNKAKIVSACDRAVTRGALLPQGETETSRSKIEAKFTGRFERGECSADICVEQIDALPVLAREPERQTTSGGNGHSIETPYGAMPSGNELVKAAIHAMEPFTKTVREGGIVQAAKRGPGAAQVKLVEAIDASREKTRLLAALNGEVQKGFVIRAATLNYVDPAANNPLGLLNTELMVLNNLGHLENQLAPIRDITTNIAGMPVAFNQQVRTRYFAIPKVQLKTSTTAWSTNQTGSNTDVNVKLDTYAGVPISFENTMLASTPRALFREQYDPQLYGLGEYILYKLINTIFAGNTRISNDDSTTATLKFQDNAANVFSIAGATLRTFVSDLPAKLDLLKIPGGDEPPGAADLMRMCWVHTQPYAAATADTNFVLNQSIQSIRGNSSNGNVMETGLFERLGNLKFRKSQLMADAISVTGTGADATTNGISVNAPDFNASTYVGFAGTRSSLLFVSRVPEDYTQVLPNIPSTAAVETVTSPQLGITFLLVKYLDHAYEIANARIQLMFGFAIGDERQGVLLSK